MNYESIQLNSIEVKASFTLNENITGSIIMDVILIYLSANMTWKTIFEEIHLIIRCQNRYHRHRHRRRR